MITAERDHCNKTVDIYEDVSSPSVSPATWGKPLTCWYRFRAFRGTPRDWILRVRFKKFKVGVLVNATTCAGGYLQVRMSFILHPPPLNPHKNKINWNKFQIRLLMISFEGLWFGNGLLVRRYNRAIGSKSESYTRVRCTMYTSHRDVRVLLGSEPNGMSDWMYVRETSVAVSARQWRKAW